MWTTILALLALSGAAFYFMTAEERTRLLQSAVAAVRQALRAVAEITPSDEPFEEFLRARTGRPLVTPLLAGLNVLVFTSMLFAAGALGEPQTLIAWGANFTPLTTNGEWSRLLAATFVHGGVLHLAATIAGLVPLGLVLERAVGRVTFAAIYLAAGLVAAVTSLWTMSPTSVSFGASGAIFGIYGLLLASFIWAVVGGPLEPGPLPLTRAKQIAAGAAVFVVYNLFTDRLDTASELAGLVTGFAGGLLAARGVIAEKPPVGRAALVTAVAILIAAGAAFPLRGTIDARPEIAGVLAVEQRTAAAYEGAVANFRLGRVPAKALVQLIERTIIPDLQRVRARVKGLRGVPREQAPLVTAAEDYFRLREQSWRDRVEGLLKSRMELLRKADLSERAALEAFERIRPDAQDHQPTGG
jgi:membrane associated rhomboid family serine protease